jgi:phage-related protein
MEPPKRDRQLIYLGSSKKDAETLPQDVKDLFTDALRMALAGETHQDAKPFRYHGSGVYEVVADYRSDTFREVYTVRYPEVVFVIHIFQKKSKRGSETPKQDKETIEKRLKWAEEVYEEQYGKKSKKKK